MRVPSKTQRKSPKVLLKTLVLGNQFKFKLFRVDRDANQFNLHSVVF